MVSKWKLGFFVHKDHPILNKQNVSLFLLLRSNETSNYYLVINCHVLYNNNRGDIKTAQISLIRRTIFLILRYIEYNSEKFQINPQNVKILWAGDFNITPSSPLYPFIKNGDFSHLAKYRKFEWSGQSQTSKLWNWLTIPKYKKFNIQATKFTKERDNFLKIEENPETFLTLLDTLSRVQLNISGEEVELSLREVEEDYFTKLSEFYLKGGKIDYTQLSTDLRFKSGYSEVQRVRGRDWEHFENIYTSFPDNFPICVDYVM